MDNNLEVENKFQKIFKIVIDKLKRVCYNKYVR